MATVAHYDVTTDKLTFRNKGTSVFEFSDSNITLYKTLQLSSDTFKIKDQQSGAYIPVTATAAELNVLDGASASVFTARL